MAPENKAPSDLPHIFTRQSLYGWNAEYNLLQSKQFAEIRLHIELHILCSPIIKIKKNIYMNQNLSLTCSLS